MTNKNNIFHQIAKQYSESEYSNNELYLTSIKYYQSNDYFNPKENTAFEKHAYDSNNQKLFLL